MMMKDAGFINISALTMVTWRRNSDRRGTELWRSLEAKFEGRRLGEPGLRSLSLRQGPGGPFRAPSGKGDPWLLFWSLQRSS